MCRFILKLRPGRPTGNDVTDLYLRASILLKGLIGKSLDTLV